MRTGQLLPGWCLLLLLAVMPVASLAAPPWKVSVLYWSDSIPGQLAMREGLRRQVKRHNQAVARQGRGRALALNEWVAGDGPDGVELQISQFYHVLKHKPDLIIVQPADSAALTEPLLLANREGIPVLAFDQYIEGGQLAGLVTSNNYQAGYLAGEVVADSFPQNRNIRLVMLEYPLVSSTVMRADGFLDALEDLEQAYTLVQTYQAVEPDSGRKAAQALLAAFPEPGSVDVVFSVNDGAGLAFRQALEAAGRQEIRLASVDGDPSQIASLKAGGALLVDSAQLCGVIGEQTIRVALDLLQGNGPAGMLYQIPAYPVTAETLTGYKGWNGGIPESFSKPWVSRKPEWSNRIQTMSLTAHE